MTRGQAPSDGDEAKHPDLEDSSSSEEEGEEPEGGSLKRSFLEGSKVLSLPFDDGQVAALRAGDWVSLEGEVIVIGWRASRRLLVELAEGEDWPLDLHQQTILHATPAPAPPDALIGVLEPDPSSFYDLLTLKMLEAGARCFVGYGPRNDDVLERMKKRRSLYLVLPSGAGALFSQCVVESEIVAWPELKEEGIHRIKVSGFPALVAVDGFGRNLFVRKAMTGSFPALLLD